MLLKVPRTHGHRYSAGHEDFSVGFYDPLVGVAALVTGHHFTMAKSHITTLSSV